MKKTPPNLKAFRFNGIPFLVVDPSTLPVDALAALNRYMHGKTVKPSHLYLHTGLGGVLRCC